jgi:sugar lactone lactonase YvrE
VTAPDTPWFASARLAPDSTYGLGADGIAFRDDSLFVTSYGHGRLLRLVRDDAGRPAGMQVIAKGPDLVTADGLTFDAFGRAWITTNVGALVMVGRGGGIVVANTPAGALDYPTQATIGCHGQVYVLNGSYDLMTPSLVVLSR